MRRRRASGGRAIGICLVAVVVLVAVAGCEPPSRPAKENLAEFEAYAEGLAGVIRVQDATVLTPDKAMVFESPTDTSATVRLDPDTDPEVVATTCYALSSWSSSAWPNPEVRMHVRIQLGSLRMDLPNDPEFMAVRLQIAEQLAADPEIVDVLVESVHGQVGTDLDNSGLTFYLQRSATADAATIAQRWAGPLTEVAPLGILNVDHRGAQRGAYRPEVNRLLSGQPLTS